MRSRWFAIMWRWRRRSRPPSSRSSRRCSPSRHAGDRVVTHAEAIDLIRDAVPQSGGVWADLGAGSGTFSRALAELLGPGGVVHAVDRDARTVAALRATPSPTSVAADITVTQADFTKALSLGVLDGILMANALHFVPHAHQAELLVRLTGRLAPTGRIVLVEYDRDEGNPWVPYPVSMAALARLAHLATLTAPIETAHKPSTFGGALYCAWMARD